MTHYATKRFTILMVFILIVFAIGFLIYLAAKPPRATCYDGIKNQGEKDIDCGGPCGQCDEPENLVLEQKDFIPTTQNNFDLVAKVRNLNQNWAIDSISYKFDLYKNGSIISSRTGKTYILPQESKYIIEQKIFSGEFPDRVEIELTDINWKKVKDLGDLDVTSREVNFAIDPFLRLFGVIRNKSNFSLERVDVIGLLFAGNKIIAVGKTSANTVLSNEDRYFEMNWPYAPTKEITDFQAKTYINIFRDDNFMRTHSTTLEKFQERLTQ